MTRATRIVAGAVAALALSGCGLRMPNMPDLPDLPDLDAPDVDLPTVELPRIGGPDAPQPAPDSGVEVMTSSPEVEFHTRASAFYERLTGRRFNSLASYRDEGLREYFPSAESYADYFSDLAQDLAEAHFERNQPVWTVVDEFLVDAPGRARVRVHIVGNNGLPLRFWSTRLEREDLWERRDGRWWIVPSAL
jgi:hypothetical protein